ncbi:hypothetical protein GCM10010912_16710 [Paenibacillus albidus]|uniref:Bacteriophage lambda Replication protein O N-terminal domain-containing protein n=1 Tax=Paenibacillus albidus TaxID=2041023 RepID=A0A917FD71_9BACL|nr:replication protein [Paenibacillus albidus]GGF72258.1 hypothetical protein GCM10010912_16710 [Paenibacillus albidus]
MDSNVNPQPTDAHIRISHEIHRELIRRKFSKRQRDVIDFILTLSWGCGKPSAIIPELKNFEEAGIRQNHIREVLDDLIAGKVVLWDKEMSIFQVNKHFDLWEIDSVSSSAKKFNELINLNLARPSPNLLKQSVPKKGTEPPKEEPGPQKGNTVTKKGSKLPKKEPSSQKGNHSVPKKGTEFPKEELPSSQKGNRSVPKKGTVKRDYPCHIKGFSDSKASIKASIKKRFSSSSTSTRIHFEGHTLASVLRDYADNFCSSGRVTAFDKADLTAYYNEYGGEWLSKALREAYRMGPEKRNLAYVHGVLKGYRDRGGADVVREQEPNAGLYSSIDGKKTTKQLEIERLERIMREEAALHA